MAHSASTPPQRPGRRHYAVPQPMAWPIMGSASLFLMALGAVFVFNGMQRGLGRRSPPASCCCST